MTRPLEERFWEKVEKGSGCWRWTACVDGYGYGVIGKDSSGRLAKAHRVSWELRHGEIPQGMLVCHHCDNPPCVRPGHLFLGTNKDNMQDSAKKGRTMCGSKNGNSALTEVAVAQIRALYDPKGATQRILAKKFGVSESNIRSILRRRTWKHVQ